MVGQGDSDASCYTATLPEPLPYTMSISWGHSSREMSLWISQQLSTSITPCSDNVNSCNWFADRFVHLSPFWDRKHIDQVVNIVRMARELDRPWDQREHVCRCVQAGVGAVLDARHHSASMAFSQAVLLLSLCLRIWNRPCLELGKLNLLINKNIWFGWSSAYLILCGRENMLIV